MFVFIATAFVSTPCEHPVAASTTFTAPMMTTNGADDIFSTDDLLLDAKYEAASREQTFEKLAAPSALPPLPDGRRA